LKTISINSKDVCNLSRVPIGIDKNPIYRTALQFQKNKSLNIEETELFAHYRDYNPKTLFDLYGVVNKLKYFSYCDIFLPWIHTEPIKYFSDSAFIYRDKNFILKQAEKIKNLLDSFKNMGFMPNKFPDRKDGNITGYFLKDENSKIFYVVSGNHRVAVHSAMFPDKLIPVAYEEEGFAKPRDRASRGAGFLEEYNLGNVSRWPCVTHEFLTPEDAYKIARRYFND
jgi:hypothetical protein